MSSSDIISLSTAPNIERRRPWRRWANFKAVLATTLLAELLAWWLLRGDVWRKLGLGWQLWLVVVSGSGVLTSAAAIGVWFFRRRLQFGLRSLLMAVLIVGSALGLVGMQLQRTEKQRMAAAALESMGANVSYRGENQPGLLTFIGRQYFQEPIAVGLQGALSEDNLANLGKLSSLELLSLANVPISDADLAAFASFRELRTFHLVRSRITGHGLRHLKALDLTSLDLCWSPIDDDGLASVGQLSKLSVLNLNHTRITDAGLVHLTTLGQLWALYLDGTMITGKGLIHLSRLPELHEISLSRTWIANTELPCLRQLPALTSLNLSNTIIDDGGVETLCGMSGLQNLQLHGTDITEDGIHRLQQALPNCQILH